jgi:rRNA-processing protein FCF1
MGCFPDMDKLQRALENNHIKYCTEKNLDPQEELEKAEKAMEHQFIVE